MSTRQTLCLALFSLIFFFFLQSYDNYYDNIEHEREIELLEYKIKLQDETATMYLTLCETLVTKLNKRYSFPVDVTSYSPTKDQCDNTPFITASNKRVCVGGVAVSRDLFRDGWTFGKNVHIEGYGIFTINDLMNKRFKKRIDIFQWNRHNALSFGKQQATATLMEINQNE